MARLVLSSLWILIGVAASGGVYWGFLNTPESSVGALILSAVLLFVSIALAAMTISGATLIWSDGWSRTLPRRSLSNTPLIVGAMAGVVVLWLIVDMIAMRINSRSGEIDAWFIARFGLADVSWLFSTITWLSRWIRWVAAPVALLSLVSGRRPTLKMLSLATIWFGALVALPWIYLAPWRPRGLPPTSIEPIFIATKLAMTFVLMAIGFALCLREVAPGTWHDARGTRHQAPGTI